MKAPRAPIPRLRSYSGPAILAYGFRPFFFGAALAAVLGLVVWLAILTGGPRAAERLCAADLARPRDAVRLRRGSRRRFPADGDPQLDGRAAAAWRAAADAGDIVAGRTARRSQFGRHRRLAGGRGRSRLPRCSGVHRRPRSGRRQELAQPADAGGAAGAAERQRPDASGGSRTGADGDDRLAAGGRRRHLADRADRRAHRSELHPQLARQTRRACPSGTRRPLRSGGNRGDRGCPRRLDRSSRQRPCRWPAGAGRCSERRAPRPLARPSDARRSAGLRPACRLRLGGRRPRPAGSGAGRPRRQASHCSRRVRRSTA